MFEGEKVSDLTLAALLCSRLCHDLIGSIAAVKNGVELIAEHDDKALVDEAQKLIALSAGEAVRRVQFCRLAFGAAGGIGAADDLAEARRVAEGLTFGGKVELRWDAAIDTTTSIGVDPVKLALNMLLLAIEALPRGGTAGVTIAAAEDMDIVVTAVGKGARLVDASRRALTGQLAADDLDARSAQPYYAAALATALGASIEVDTGEDRVTMAARGVALAAPSETAD